MTDGLDRHGRKEELALRAANIETLAKMVRVHVRGAREVERLEKIIEHAEAIDDLVDQ